MSASSDVNGNEASSAPANELRLASSLIATTSKAVIATLTNNASMTHLLDQLPVSDGVFHQVNGDRSAPSLRNLPELRHASSGCLIAPMTAINAALCDAI